MNTDKLLLAALPGSTDLAASLAALLGCQHTTLAHHRFPDGESLVRYEVPLQGRRVLLVAHMHQPDGKTLPLLFAADAARDLGATQVGLLVPYLPYMRQDQRFRPGEAITARSYARLLSASIDFLLTVDPHLHRFHSLDQIYSVPARVVPAAPAIADWLRLQVPAPLLVGPDSESDQWVSDVAARIGAPWTTLVKQRHGDHSVQIRLAGGGDWRDRTPVLLDDIISTGGTLATAAGVLRQAGYVAPMCIGVHALFAPDTTQRLAAAGFERVVTCDTVPHASNGITLAPLLGQAVREMLAATA